MLISTEREILTDYKNKTAGKMILFGFKILRCDINIATNCYFSIDGILCICIFYILYNIYEQDKYHTHSITSWPGFH